MMHPLPRILFLILCLAWLSVSFAAVAGDDPDPAEILRAARMNQSAQSALLEGRLRTADKSTPFQLTLDEGTVTYAFRDPPQDIVLKLGDDAPELFERLGNKRVEVTSARFDKTVRDTGITYEDLSLSFLYWPRPTLLGSDSLRTRSAWKLEIQAPRKESQYGVARLWIDKESGALLRVEGYNKQGRLRRRFEVISAQKIDGLWLLKQMRVETFDPETRKVERRDYLEITGLTKAPDDVRSGADRDR